MAFGDLKGTLTGSATNTTNPANATGSVSVAVGDLIFCTFAQQTALTTTGASDNLGNTYSAVNAGTDAGTITARSFYSRVTVAGTLTTVSFAATGSSNNASCIADVIEGPFVVSPLDANPANTTDNSSPYTCPATGTLTQADEVVMAAIAIASTATIAATSPSTICGAISFIAASSAQSRRVVSATTTVTPEFTSATDDTSVQIVASFKKEVTVDAVFIGTATGTFGQTGAFAGASSHSGTSAFSFGQTGALNARGAIVGTATITFSQSGDFVAEQLLDANFAGTLPITFSQTGALTSSSLHTGTATAIFAQTGALQGNSTNSGTTTITFSQTGAFGARSGYSGTIPVVFSQSGLFVASGFIRPPHSYGFVF